MLDMTQMDRIVELAAADLQVLVEPGNRSRRPQHLPGEARPDIPARSRQQPDVHGRRYGGEQLARHESHQVRFDQRLCTWPDRRSG